MIPSQIVVDTEAVKKAQYEATNWTAVCKICGVELTGTISQLKEHKHVCK